MKNYNQEIEDLLTMGRNIPETEFDKYLDSYFAGKSDSEKGRIGEETLKIKLSKWEQIKKIDNKIRTTQMFPRSHHQLIWST